jgi:hypothetical protein
MSKIRTEEQPAPEHTHAVEFEKKIEPNAKAAQVHANTLKHSYESALNVRPDDADSGDTARGTEVGKPDIDK